MHLSWMWHTFSQSDWMWCIQISVKVPSRNILTLPENNKRPASESLGVWDHSNILSVNSIAMFHAFSLKSQKNEQVFLKIKKRDDLPQFKSHQNSMMWSDLENIDKNKDAEWATIHQIWSQLSEEYESQTNISLCCDRTTTEDLKVSKLHYDICLYLFIPNQLT